jgi:hypothetical protein
MMRGFELVIGIRRHLVRRILGLCLRRKRRLFLKRSIVDRQKIDPQFSNVNVSIQTCKYSSLSFTFLDALLEAEPKSSADGRWRHHRSLRLASNCSCRLVSPRLEPPLSHLQGLLHGSRDYDMSAYILLVVHSTESKRRSSLSGMSNDKHL